MLQTTPNKSIFNTLGYPPKRIAPRFSESVPKNENFEKSFYGERFGPHSDHLTPQMRLGMLPMRLYMLPQRDIQAIWLILPSITMITMIVNIRQLGPVSLTDSDHKSRKNRYGYPILNQVYDLTVMASLLK